MCRYTRKESKLDSADKSQICISERSTNVFGLHFSRIFVGKFKKKSQNRSCTWHLVGIFLCFNAKLNKFLIICAVLQKLHTALLCLFHTKSILFFSSWILVKMLLFSTSHPSQFLTGCNAIDSISGACRQLGTMVMFGFYHICCFLLNTIERLLSNCEIKLLSSQKVKPR